ncbi:ABC transporter permease [Rhizobium alvei]|uniref:ABC transporter permease subunit n=1 Tax=Rhizobium alvei TaxID=1132659 RepID=A0ABT8YN43_9HYPH|nr:ABC transporter permease subunit [Rhizobium alvei]MDO6964645.1 ABC transporter permease subunit [Rhizobium alvei]
MAQSVPSSRNLTRWMWIALGLLTVVMALYGRDLLNAAGLGFFAKYPKSSVIPLAKWLSAAMKWLIEDASFGLFSFTDLTRAIAWLIDLPYQFVLSLLATGFRSGFGDDAVLWMPQLSWVAVIVVAIMIGHYAGGVGLALLSGAAFLYLALFGQWTSAMVTLASIAIAVPLGIAGGVGLGVLAYRSTFAERILRPVLDLMQTIPTFAYLVPILFMFGFGPVAALVATIVYALPPMVRITLMALKDVDPEIHDFGVMVGTTDRQMLWKVLLPAAKPGLMIGVNQVIMLSLNMVIIASMIGAGGLGYDVLTALRRLHIGEGLEAGIAIVVLAVALDRISQAFATRRRLSAEAKRGGPLMERYPQWTPAVIVLALTMGLSFLLPGSQSFPESLTFSTGSFWEHQIEWLNVNFFDAFEAFKVALLQNFMLPIKKFLLSLPWAFVVLLILAAGYTFGGFRMAVKMGALALFLAVTGLWDFAMVTVYLCGASVIIACLIGIPLGVWAAVSPMAGRIIGGVIDTLQTLPSFVYLIPVVMLFRVGDFTAMVAIVLYALAPAVRYTAFGIRNIDPQIIEAGIVSGCTQRQLLTRIRLPLALPEIMLGLNQTIMLALSMLVITALVGTRDLGQEAYSALTKADTGRGLVAGLAIAAIAIIADRLISAASQNLRKRYGQLPRAEG